MSDRSVLEFFCWCGLDYSQNHTHTAYELRANLDLAAYRGRLVVAEGLIRQLAWPKYRKLDNFCPVCGDPIDQCDHDDRRLCIGPELRSFLASPVSPTAEPAPGLPPGGEAGREVREATLLCPRCNHCWTEPIIFPCRPHPSGDTKGGTDGK